MFKYLALSGLLFFLKPSAILAGIETAALLACDVHKAPSWGMIHYVDKRIKQIDAPFARRLNLESPLQAVFSFWILTPGFWIL